VALLDEDDPRENSFLTAAVVAVGMDYQRVEGGREYAARVEHDRDWRGQIEAFADDEDIDAAFFSGLGAVQDAELRFYDRDEQECDPIEFGEPFEVTAAPGSVSHLGDGRFAQDLWAL
jgi:predicted DNA-binding protein with PD1-like motif